jgi:hypothetical protein
LILSLLLRENWLAVSDQRIPPQEDVPALVALLSEQIADVKFSIDDLKQGLNDGLRHLEVRLDDHAVRLTNLERSEIRREEAERVKAQMLTRWDDAGEKARKREHAQLTKLQVKSAWFGVCLACVTFIASEIHAIIT